MCFDPQRRENSNNNNNNNNNSNANDSNTPHKPRMRKIFTTQTPTDNKELNRNAKHRHRQSMPEPPAPHSSRGYIVHGKKKDPSQQQIQQRSNTVVTTESSQYNTQRNMSQSSQAHNNNNNKNTVALKSGVKPYQNVKKIVSNKKYRFISPLFILEVWHEKHAITDNIDSNSNDNNNNNQQQSRNYYNSYSKHHQSYNNSQQYIQYDIGNFYTLSLNLDAIVHSWGSARDRQLPLLNFLLLRETYQSKRIILKMLFEMISNYCIGYKYDVRSKLDCISEYFVTINQVLRRAVEESIEMAQEQRQAELAKQQQEQLQQKQSGSLGSRMRRATSALAPRLFGSGNTSSNPSAPTTPSATTVTAATATRHSQAAPHSVLPPPPGVNQSKSMTHLDTHHTPLPAPTMNGMNNNISNKNSKNIGSNVNNNNMRVGGGSGRRVAPTVRYDLQKTRLDETVIQANELLERVFYRINDMIDRRQDELDVMANEPNYYDNDNNIMSSNVNSFGKNNNKNIDRNRNEQINDVTVTHYTDLKGLSKKEALIKEKKTEQLNNENDSNINTNDNNNNNNDIGSNENTNKNSNDNGNENLMNEGKSGIRGNDELKEMSTISSMDNENLQKVKKRFIAILIEYTRTMHRMRLKLPISISMLLIKLLRKSKQLYTLHQLFQYHAFPDDEKLAYELLDIAATFGGTKNSLNIDNNNIGKANNYSVRKDSIVSIDHTEMMNGGSYLTSKQLGIDMLLRLGHWSKICKILINEGEIYAGVRLFLEKYPFDKKSNTEHLQLTDFLNAAMNKDPICFYHLYNGLNMIISSHHSVFNYYNNIYQTFTATTANAANAAVTSVASVIDNTTHAATPRGMSQKQNNINNMNKVSASDTNILKNNVRGANVYEYNHESTETNLSLLFAEELMTFQQQFQSLHSTFSQ